MLTAIAGRRWVIEHGLHLAVMKCGESTELRQAFTDVVPAGIAKGMSEGLKYEEKHGKAKLDLEAIEAYDPKAEAKYIAALHALKNLKYSLVDQLESLKDVPMDVIIASLHLESDTKDDASQWIRELPDAIAANVSRAKKKKKCRVMQLHRLKHLRTRPLSGCLGRALCLLCIVESSHSTACVCTGSVLCARGSLCTHTQRLGCMLLRSQSPRPLGLQPVYAAGRLQECLASNYPGIVMDDKQS
nr:hypothetical protein [Tanacetum cinerariifolium]